MSRIGTVANFNSKELKIMQHQTRIRSHGPNRGKEPHFQHQIIHSNAPIVANAPVPAPNRPNRHKKPVSLSPTHILRILAIFFISFVICALYLPMVKELFNGNTPVQSASRHMTTAPQRHLSPKVAAALRRALARTHQKRIAAESQYFRVVDQSEQDDWRLALEAATMAPHKDLFYSLLDEKYAAESSSESTDSPLPFTEYPLVESHDSNPNPDTMNSTEYYHYCHSIGHMSIFRLGSRINCRDNSETLSMAFVICILFTLSIELVLHYFEHKFRHDLLKMTILNKIYKEIMMLSIISSLISAIESLDLFAIIFETVDNVEHWIEEILHIKITPDEEDPIERTERRVRLFEFVHVSLFFLSLWYVCIVSVCYRFTRRKWKSWKSYEKNWTAEKAILDFKRLSDQMWKKKFTLPFRWILIYQFYESFARKNYFTVRKRFIILNKLQCSYRFDAYMKQSAMRIFANLIEISLLLWTVVWIGFLVNYARNKLIDLRTTYGGVPLFIIVFGYGSILVAFVLYVSLMINFKRYVNKNSLDSYLLGPYLEEYEKRLVEGLPTGPHSGINNGPQKALTYGSIQGIDSKYPQDTDDEEEIYKEMDTLEQAGYELNVCQCKSMRRYFFLWSSSLSFYSIQFTILLQAFYISMLIIHFSFVIFVEPYFTNFASRLGLFLVSLLPTYVFVFILFPLIVPLYTLLASVDDHTNTEVVKSSQKNQDASEKEVEDGGAHGH